MCRGSIDACLASARDGRVLHSRGLTRENTGRQAVGPGSLWGRPTSDGGCAPRAGRSLLDSPGLSPPLTASPPPRPRRPLPDRPVGATGTALYPRQFAGRAQGVSSGFEVFRALFSPDLHVRDRENGDRPRSVQVSAGRCAWVQVGSRPVRLGDGRGADRDGDRDGGRVAGRDAARTPTSEPETGQAAHVGDGTTQHSTTLPS